MTSNFSCETVKIMLINPIPLAWAIEAAVKPYLISISDTNRDNNKKVTVYDIHGRPHHEVVVQPTIVLTTPVVGMEIIKSYIERILITNSAWSKQKIPTVFDIWQEYIVPEYKDNVDVYDLIENLLTNIYTDIREFLGNDKWIVHLQKNRYSDIVIEKCIDYRIYWYKQHFGNNIM